MNPWKVQTMTTPSEAPKRVRKSKLKPHTITIVGRPVPKGRPRLGRRGRVFTPEKTLIAEGNIRMAWNGPKYEVPVSIDIIFNKDETTVTVAPMMETIPSKMRGDLDNYIKTLMDGLNGAAWLDDKQVHRIIAIKE